MLSITVDGCFTRGNALRSRFFRNYLYILRYECHAPPCNYYTWIAPRLADKKQSLAYSSPLISPRLRYFPRNYDIYDHFLVCLWDERGEWSRSDSWTDPQMLSYPNESIKILHHVSNAYVTEYLLSKIEMSVIEHYHIPWVKYNLKENVSCITHQTLILLKKEWYTHWCLSIHLSSVGCLTAYSSITMLG